MPRGVEIAADMDGTGDVVLGSDGLGRCKRAFAMFAPVVGSVLCVAGACLEWDRAVPTWAVGAIAVAPAPVTAFGLWVGRASVGWLICAASLASLAASWAWPPGHGSSAVIGSLRVATAVFVVALALLHAAPHVGVIVTALGAALMALGAAPVCGGRS